MALYGPAQKRLIPPGPTDPRIKARVLILHVAVSEQPSLYSYFNGPSGGVESHFYVRRDGTVEQYRDTAWQADANTDANGFAISIETQGMEHGEWTPEQLAAIKALTLWCHHSHGIPLSTVTTWDGAGVGYHTLFPGRWDKRGATCPGPDRIKQFTNVLVPWMASGGNEDDMPTAQDLLNAPAGVNPADRKTLVDVGDRLAIASNYAFYSWQILRAIAPKVGVEVDEKALAAEILSTLAPTVRDAVTAAASAGGTPAQIADLVVARIGEALTTGASQ